MFFPKGAELILKSALSSHNFFIVLTPLPLCALTAHTRIRICVYEAHMH